MKRTILIIVLLCSIYLQDSALAQPVLEWSAIYAGVGNSGDKPVEMIISDSGNIYIGANSRGYLMLKYNPYGNLLWDGRAEDSSIVEAIAVDRWGNAVATGCISASHYNIYTARFANSDGHVIFSKQVDPLYTPNHDHGWDVAVDSSGYVYVTGFVFAGAWPWGTGNDWMTLSYQPSGVVHWIQQFNGTDSTGDRSTSIDVTPGGVAYYAGYVRMKDGQIGINKLRIVKNDFYGPDWEHIYDIGGATGDLELTILTKVTKDEDVYVTAHTGYNDDKDALLIKHDVNGNHEWTRTYNGPDDLEDYPVDLALDNEGNVLVLCFSQDANNQESMATLKYSPEGDTLWMKRYQLNNIEPKALAVDSDENAYALSSNIMVKYNSDGNQEWVENYEGDYAIDIAVDAQNNIYVTGWESFTGTAFDIVTVKYSQATGINDPGTSNLPTEFNLLQNYPNPFNPSTKIRYTIPSVIVSKAKNLVTLKVYDVLGNEVATLVDEYKPSGSYDVEFNGNGLTSGVYFYQFRSGSFIQTKKMILMK